jgi:hypothetical protein
VRRALAARYLAIAVAGNRRLEIDFDRLDGRDRSDLAAARADLRDAAATERLFDQRLAGIAFPAATEKISRLLIASNQARAALTAAAAGSVSLAQLRAYERRLIAANGPVEEAVGVIRSQLGLPPADASRAGLARLHAYTPPKARRRALPAVGYSRAAAASAVWLAARGPDSLVMAVLQPVRCPAARSAASSSGTARCWDQGSGTRQPAPAQSSCWAACHLARGEVCRGIGAPRTSAWRGTCCAPGGQALPRAQAVN